MKFFNVTVERTYRISKDFEAERIAEAEEIAVKIACNIGEEIFACDVETDYALCDEQGCTIIDWD